VGDTLRVLPPNLDPDVVALYLTTVAPVIDRGSLSRFAFEDGRGHDRRVPLKPCPKHWKLSARAGTIPGPEWREVFAALAKKSPTTIVVTPDAIPTEYPPPHAMDNVD
jgi:hypothetical protein